MDWPLSHTHTLSLSLAGVISLSLSLSLSRSLSGFVDPKKVLSLPTCLCEALGQLGRDGPASG